MDLSGSTTMCLELLLDVTNKEADSFPFLKFLGREITTELARRRRGGPIRPLPLSGLRIPELGVGVRVCEVLGHRFADHAAHTRSRDQAELLAECQQLTLSVALATSRELHRKNSARAATAN